MDTEKLIVVMLLIAILLSVVTLAITISANVVVGPTGGASQTSDLATASVVLEIIEKPSGVGR
jgi:hypothetical protein